MCAPQMREWSLHARLRRKPRAAPEYIPPPGPSDRSLITVRDPRATPRDRARARSDGYRQIELISSRLTGPRSGPGPWPRSATSSIGWARRLSDATRVAGGCILLHLRVPRDTVADVVAARASPVAKEVLRRA